MPVVHRPLVVAALGVALALLLQGVHPQMHTQVEILDDSCDAQLDALWANYTNPAVVPVAGCDRDCLAACYNTLQWAIYSEKQQNCPTQAEIIACFHPYRAKWYAFVEQCALFQFGVSASAEGEGEGGSSTSTSSTSSSEGEATATTAEGAAAEGAASTSSAAEGEASPTTSSSSSAAAEGEAAPAAATTSTAGAEGELGRRRRTLLQEAEAALGDGGVNVYNGCFPTFESSEDFEAYMNGEFVFETSSAGVGIALSVIFFTSLLLVGFGLPKFVKQPLKKGWTWVKDHTLCCFRRRPSGPTKLPAPTAPAAEAVGEAVDAAPTPAAAPAS